MVYLAALWGRRGTHDPLDNQCLAFSIALKSASNPVLRSLGSGMRQGWGQSSPMLLVNWGNASGWTFARVP